MAGQILFRATDGTNGSELWTTDGTAAGTSLLKDIVAGSSSSSPSSITSLGNGSALFQANDGTNGVELWITDGTAAGTSLLKDIRTWMTLAHPLLHAARPIAGYPLGYRCGPMLAWQAGDSRRLHTPRGNPRSVRR